MKKKIPPPPVYHMFRFWRFDTNTQTIDEIVEIIQQSVKYHIQEMKRTIGTVLQSINKKSVEKQLNDNEIFLIAQCFFNEGSDPVKMHDIEILLNGIFKDTCRCFCIPDVSEEEEDV